MISYLQSARELDERWTASLQFLPPTPALRSTHDCITARKIAATELDLFDRYAREIAAENGLKLANLVDLYDLLLITGLIAGIELNDSRIGWREPPRRSRAAVDPRATAQAETATPAASEQLAGRRDARGRTGRPRQPMLPVAESPRKPRSA